MDLEHSPTLFQNPTTTEAFGKCQSIFSKDGSFSILRELNSNVDFVKFCEEPYQENSWVRVLV